MRSRAWKRYAIEPPAPSSTAASSPTDHSPASAHWLSASPSARRVAAALAAGVADVGLRGAQRVPVGGLGEAAGVDADGLLVDAQQLLDRSLGLLVGALAEVVEADAPVAIDEVDGRPVVVVERPPDREVVVDDDRVADAQLARRAAHVVEVVLEPELRRVRADDDEPALAVPLVPTP